MDYEKAYTNAVARAKQAIKDCGHNEGRKRMIEGIFPELKESEDERIRKEIIKHLRLEIETELTLSEDEGKRWIDWLEKQGEQKPAWSEEDITNYSKVLFCLQTLTFPTDAERKELITWLEKQGEWNNLVEQLTAFAVHLQKRGTFRDDLCMDFEHEAQSFIESQNSKEL